MYTYDKREREHTCTWERSDLVQHAQQLVKQLRKIENLVDEYFSHIPKIDMSEHVSVKSMRYVFFIPDTSSLVVYEEAPGENVLRWTSIDLDRVEEGNVKINFANVDTPLSQAPNTINTIYLYLELFPEVAAKYENTISRIEHLIEKTAKTGKIGPVQKRESIIPELTLNVQIRDWDRFLKILEELVRRFRELASIYGQIAKSRDLIMLLI